MQKFKNFISYFAIGIFLPLILNLQLILDIRILIISIASVIIIFSQPAMDTKDAVKDKNTDRNSVWWIAILSLISLMLPILEWAYLLNTSIINYYSLGLGLLLIVIGLTIRVWAIRVLGKFFSATVKVRRDHEVIQSGPYKVVRHPSYLGAYLTFLGSPILLEAWYSLPIVMMAMGIAYYIRISTEERTLTEHFGEKYKRYKRYSWRMIPGIW